MKTITFDLIEKAAQLLKEAAPNSTIILFGSYARGNARPDSDVDILVIEPELKRQHQEMIRLADVLRPLRIPAEVLVTNQEQFQKWCELPGTVYYAATQEGKVL